MTNDAAAANITFPNHPYEWTLSSIDRHNALITFNNDHKHYTPAFTQKNPSVYSRPLRFLLMSKIRLLNKYFNKK
jgi:hypothetical protein